VTSTLSVTDLGKTFRSPDGSTAGIRAVDGVSFEVPSGSCLAIVGESGSGKSTVARMIAGLETPSQGAILVDGEARPALPWSRHQRRRLAHQVQMVFQDPNSSLDPAQTVRATLAEALGHAPERPEQMESAVSELLERVGLHQRHADVRPRFLSGGEKQRVAIARALAVSPGLLILDESVAALDVSVQAQILNLLVDLRVDLGLTYLFISHDLAVVRQISDECIVMQAGLVIERGSTAEVLMHPTHPYTKSLLSAVPGPGWTPRRRDEGLG